MWRPVLAHLDTITNVRKLWTLDDLLDSFESLDEQQAFEAEAMAKAKGAA